MTGLRLGGGREGSLVGGDSADNVDEGRKISWWRFRLISPPDEVLTTYDRGVSAVSMIEPGSR